MEHARRTQPSAKITEQETLSVVERMKHEAMQAAAKGVFSMFFLISSFERLDDKDKDTPIGRGADFKIMESISAAGIEIEYKDDLDCGFCHLLDCAHRAHYGYKLSWEAKEPAAEAEE